VLLYAFTAADQAIVGKAAVGAVLIAAVLFMPDGLLGRVRRRGARPGAVAAAAATPVTPAAPDPSATPVTSAAAVIAAVRVGAAAAAPPAAPVAVAAAATPAAPLLAVRSLRKSFRGVRALDGVDLDVRDGEILGVLGPNGSGKSTLINVISGHYRADAGSLRFAGHDLVRWPAHRIARAGIARTYQIPRPFAHLTVQDNVALTAMFGAAAMSVADAARAALQWLVFTGLEARAAMRPGDLNLHQTKFLELARALAARPRLLLLDEVLSGLAPAEIDEAVKLILRIRAQGTTIVLVEHVMRVVTSLSDRIVVLDQGRVLAEGAPAEVMARDDVAIAYLGKLHA
jgi:branched-chain amino acid transport system permease protein